jgi:hypothetical protein
VILLSSIANASLQTFDTSQLPVRAIVEKPVAPKDLLAMVQKALKQDPPLKDTP